MSPRSEIMLSAFRLCFFNCGYMNMVDDNKAMAKAIIINIVIIITINIIIIYIIDSIC